jgi:hypothetical protein
MLDAMPLDEFEKWVESLDKLIDGDREMLIRSNVPLADENQLSRATPAPSQSRLRKENDGLPLRGNHPIKYEAIDDSSEIRRSILEPSIDHAVTHATAVMRQLSTEDRELEPPVPRVEAGIETQMISSQNSESMNSVSKHNFS